LIDVIEFLKDEALTFFINFHNEVGFGPDVLKIIELDLQIGFLSSGNRNGNNIILELVDIKVKKRLKCKVFLGYIKLFVDELSNLDPMSFLFEVLISE